MCSILLFQSQHSRISSLVLITSFSFHCFADWPVVTCVIRDVNISFLNKKKVNIHLTWGLGTFWSRVCGQPGPPLWKLTRTGASCLCDDVMMLHYMTKSMLPPAWSKSQPKTEGINMKLLRLLFLLYSLGKVFHQIPEHGCWDLLTFHADWPLMFSDQVPFCEHLSLPLCNWTWSQIFWPSQSPPLPLTSSSRPEMWQTDLLESWHPMMPSGKSLTSLVLPPVLLLIFIAGD